MSNQQLSARQAQGPIGSPKLPPNLSLEPTSVGKPPYAAQLQRCTAGLGKAK